MPRALSVEIQRRLKPEAQEAQFLGRFKNAVAPRLPELAASVLRRARAGDAFAVWKANAQTESALVRWMHCVCSSEASDDVLERLAGQLEPSAMDLVLVLALTHADLDRLAAESGSDSSPLLRAALGRRVVLELARAASAVRRRQQAARLEPLRAPSGKLEDFGHALRDPLNGAKLHVTFVRRSLARLGVSREILDAALVVEREIDRTARVVGDYTSRAEMARTRVSLRALCTRAVQLVARDAAARGVDIGADLGAGGVELELDLSSMERVIVDLLHSAMESALRGGGKVLLSARRDGRDAVVEVRHEAAAPTPVVGVLDPNGSALAAAMQIASDHGGTLRVDSGLDRTVFHLRLPACTEDALREGFTAAGPDSA